jgi:hypothetical protein
MVSKPNLIKQEITFAVNGSRFIQRFHIPYLFPFSPHSIYSFLLGRVFCSVTSKIVEDPETSCWGAATVLSKGLHYPHWEVQHHVDCYASLQYIRACRRYLSQPKTSGPSPIKFEKPSDDETFSVNRPKP